MSIIQGWLDRVNFFSVIRFEKSHVVKISYLTLSQNDGRCTVFAGVFPARAKNGRLFFLLSSMPWLEFYRMWGLFIARLFSLTASLD